MNHANGTDPVTISVNGTTLQARDIAGNSISFGLVGWDRLDDAQSFDEPIDATAVGRVSELRYDLRNLVDVTRLDGDIGADDEAEPTATQFARSTISVEEGDEQITLPDGAYVCRFDSNIFVRLRFDAPATIRNRSRGPLTISFRHPTRVTFGFKSPVDYPRDELTVDPTPSGVATALSHLSASIETTTADRAHRNYRSYPPLLDVGTETRVPDAVRDATPETGIELVVPARLSDLFTAAPLAYYLGARVRTGELDDGDGNGDGECDGYRGDGNSPSSAAVSAPVLRAPRVGLRHEFAGGTRFGTEVRTLLRRTFFLDVLTSWLDPAEPTVREYDRLEAAGIDLEHCAGRSIAERVDNYLALPDETIDEILPAWPYRMTVTPSAEYVSALPHLLYDLAAIEVPAAAAERVNSDARGQERDQQRSSRANCSSRSSSASTSRPPPRDDGQPAAETTDELAAWRGIHGVLGDIDHERGPNAATGTAANATERPTQTPPASPTHHPRTTFTALPSAYENRLSDLEQQSDDRSVVVVFAADSIPESARAAVVDSYTRRSGAVSPTVDRVDDPTRAELADVFAAGADFLHYVGDSDGTGLACRDDTLPPDAAPGNDVRLFQLDAANATGVAETLIETGSIAGVAGYGPAAVEFSSGTDADGEGDRERELGVDESLIPTTIGELILYGQSLATAHTCATVGTDCSAGVVVGDGTHRFVAKWRPSSIQSLRADSDGRVCGTTVPFPVDPVGAHWRGSRSTHKRLIPATITHEIEPDELDEYLSNTIRPIYYEGRFYWPEEQKQLIYPIS